MNHSIVTNDVHLIGSLAGYTTGLVISLLLLVLTIRVRRLPGTPIANILVAFAAVAWNGGGFAYTLAAAHGRSPTGHLALIALAIQFTSAALWPLPILATWRPFAVRRWHRIGFRVLQGTALLAAAVTVPSLWSLALFDVALAPFGAAKMSTAFSGLALVAGAVLFLREPQTSRIVRVSALTIFLGVLVVGRDRRRSSCHTHTARRDCRRGIARQRPAGAFARRVGFVPAVRALQVRGPFHSPQCPSVARHRRVGRGRARPAKRADPCARRGGDVPACHECLRRQRRRRTGNVVVRPTRSSRRRDRGSVDRASA